MGHSLGTHTYGQACLELKSIPFFTFIKKEQMTEPCIHIQHLKLSITISFLQKLVIVIFSGHFFFCENVVQQLFVQKLK